VIYVANESFVFTDYSAVSYRLAYSSSTFFHVSLDLPEKP
jgi:hypothetical protein